MQYLMLEQADQDGVAGFLEAIFRRAGYFVDKILRGTSPAEIPIEQPTRYELVINAKTSRALGLTTDATLRLRADRVIE